MRILLDTNIVIRLSDPNDPDRDLAMRALDKLDNQGHELRIVPQVVYEYWVVATRPVENNGLGMTPQEMPPYIKDIVALFPLLKDERTVFDHWQSLVQQYEVRGLQAHDARLVAAMQRHGLTHLLTFNADDFNRFPAIAVLTPGSVLA